MRAVRDPFAEHGVSALLDSVAVAAAATYSSYVSCYGK